MGPIESYFATIAIVFVFVGVARGYAKELGNTVIILAVILVLSTLEGRISNLVLDITSRLFSAFDPESVAAQRLLAWLYTILFVAVVFASYSGRSFNIGGTQLPNPGGLYLSILVGLLNGYLIAGTLWYYQDIFDYPFRWFGRGIEQPLSETAQTMVNLLPQNLASNPVYLMLPIAFLLFVRVRG